MIYLHSIIVIFLSVCLVSCGTSKGSVPKESTSKSSTSLSFSENDIQGLKNNNTKPSESGGDQNPVPVPPIDTPTSFSVCSNLNDLIEKYGESDIYGRIVNELKTGALIEGVDYNTFLSEELKQILENPELPFVKLENLNIMQLKSTTDKTSDYSKLFDLVQTEINLVLSQARNIDKETSHDKYYSAVKTYSVLLDLRTFMFNLASCKATLPLEVPAECNAAIAAQLSKGDSDLSNEDIYTLYVNVQHKDVSTQRTQADQIKFFESLEIDQGQNYGLLYSSECIKSSRNLGYSYNYSTPLDDQIIETMRNVFKELESNRVCSEDTRSFISNCYAHLKGKYFVEQGQLSQTFYSPDTSPSTSKDMLEYYTGSDSGYVAVHSNTAVGDNPIMVSAMDYIIGYIRLKGAYDIRKQGHYDEETSDLFQLDPMYFEQEKADCRLETLDENKVLVEKGPLSIVNLWVVHQQIMGSDHSELSTTVPGLCKSTGVISPPYLNGSKIWIEPVKVAY